LAGDWISACPPPHGLDRLRRKSRASFFPPSWSPSRPASLFTALQNRTDPLLLLQASFNYEVDGARRKGKCFVDADSETGQYGATNRPIDLEGRSQHRTFFYGRPPRTLEKSDPLRGVQHPARAGRGHHGARWRGHGDFQSTYPCNKHMPGGFLNFCSHSCFADSRPCAASAEHTGKP